MKNIKVIYILICVLAFFANTLRSEEWSMGSRNGLPRTVDDKLQEKEFFRRISEGKDVVTVSCPPEFPQIICENQKIDVLIQDLDVDNLRVKMALVSNVPERNNFNTYRAIKAERLLKISFNGFCLWNRWVVEGYAEIEFFVPYNLVKKGDNKLTIHNAGTERMAFDYVDISYAKLGEKVYLNMLGVEHVKEPKVRVFGGSVLTLPHPRGAEKEAKFYGQVEASTDAEDSYMALSEFFSLEQSTNHCSEIRVWADRLGKSIKQKQLPIVMFEKDSERGSEQDWMWFTTRFGSAIGGWVCNTKQDADTIRKYVKNAPIIGVYDAENKSGFKIDGTDTTPVVLDMSIETHGGRNDRQLGKYRLDAFSKTNDVQKLIGRFMFNNPIDDDIKLRGVSEMVVEASMQWIMGGGAGIFFDDRVELLYGKGLATDSWRSVYPLLLSGRGDCERIPISVAETNVDGDSFHDTTWFAVKNNDKSISVCILPRAWDKEKDVNLYIPTLWNENTNVEITGTAFHKWEVVAPTAVPPKKLSLKTNRNPAKKSDFCGYVVLPLKLNGFLNIRLSPRINEAQTKDIKKVAPPRKQYDEVDDMFDVWQCFKPDYLYKNAYKTVTEDVEGVKKEKTRYLVKALNGVQKYKVEPAKTRKMNWTSSLEFFPDTNRVSEIKGIVPWKEDSLILDLPSTAQCTGYKLGLDSSHFLAGAMGMVMYVNVRATAPNVAEELKMSRSPAKFWMGVQSKRQLVEIPLEKTMMLFVPYQKFVGKLGNPSNLYIFMDREEKRNMVMEINCIEAVYLPKANEAPKNPSRSAVRYDPIKKTLYVMLEGDCSKVLRQYIRTENKYKFKGASIVYPKGFTDIDIGIDDENKKMVFSVNKMPSFDYRKPKLDEYFPLIRDTPADGRSRIVLSFKVER